MKYLRSFVITICALALVGCGSGVKIPFGSNGKAAENFLQEDASFVFSLNFSNGLLRDKTLLLLKDMYDAKAAKQTTDFLHTYGLDLKSNVLPLFFDKARLLISSTSKEENSEDPAIQLYNGASKADVLIVVQHSNMEKASELYRLLSEKSEWLKVEVAGEPVLTENSSHMYLALKNDFFVISNAQITLQEALERYNEGGRSLMENEDYKKALSDFDKDQLAYLYVRTNSETNSLVSANQIGLSGLNAGMYQTYGIRPKDNGFEVSGQSKFDKDILKKMKLDLQDFGGKKAYMGKLVVSKDPFMIFSESYNVARGLELMPQFSDQKTLDAFRAYFGEDIDEALYPLLNKGFALALYNSGSIFPAITIAFDSAKEIEKAKSLYNKLDSQLSGLAIAFQGQEGFQVKKENEKGFTVIKVTIAQLQELIDRMFPGVILPGIELAFGVDARGLFQISTQKDFLSKKEGVNAKKFNEAMTYIEDSDAGMTYIDFEEVEKYLKVFESAASGVQSESNFIRKESLEQLKTILSKFSFFVVGNSVYANDELRLHGQLQLLK